MHKNKTKQHAHKLGTNLEYLSHQKQPLKSGKQILIFSPYFPRQFYFLWEDVQIQGHWQFAEFGGERRREKAEGCLTEKSRENPGHFRRWEGPQG